MHAHKIMIGCVVFNVIFYTRCMNLVLKGTSHVGTRHYWGIFKYRVVGGNKYRNCTYVLGVRVDRQLARGKVHSSYKPGPIVPPPGCERTGCVEAVPGLPCPARTWAEIPAGRGEPAVAVRRVRGSAAPGGVRASPGCPPSRRNARAPAPTAASPDCTGTHTGCL